MATCRERKNGTFEFVVRRKRLLPNPIYLTFATREAGEAYCAHLEKLLDAGVVPEEFQQSRRSATLSFAQLVTRYVAGHTPKPDDVAKLDLLVLSFGKTPLTQITFEWVSRRIEELKREKQLAPGTVSKYAGALSRCLDWAVNRNLIHENPVRRLPRGYAQYSPDDVRAAGVERVDEHRDVRLPAGSEVAIRAALAAKKADVSAYLLLFDLALETAMRLREMLTLTVDQVDLVERTVFLTKTKNGSKRQVPLSTVALQRLHLYLEGHAQTLLFPWWSGSSADLKALSSRLSKAFARAFTAAGYPELRFHDLRHEATSRFFERTLLTDLEIAKITGHKDPRVLMRYANLRGSTLADKLW